MLQEGEGERVELQEGELQEGEECSTKHPLGVSLEKPSLNL